MHYDLYMVEAFMLWYLEQALLQHYCILHTKDIYYPRRLSTFPVLSLWSSMTRILLNNYERFKVM